MNTKIPFAVTFVAAALAGCTQLPVNKSAGNATEEAMPESAIEYSAVDETVSRIQLDQQQLNAGETLWSFAVRTTGDGQRWREIAELNGIEDVHNIPAGQTLLVPGQGGGDAALATSWTSTETLPAMQEDSDALMPAAADESDEFVDFDVIEAAPVRESPMRSATSSAASYTGGSTSSGAVSADAMTGGATQTYKLRDGETLCGFSQRVTGKGSNWETIARINGIVSATQVAAGSNLTVPSAMVVGNPDDVAVRKPVTAPVKSDAVAKVEAAAEAATATTATTAAATEFTSNQPPGTYREPTVVPAASASGTMPALADTNEGGGSSGSSSVLRPGETLWQFAERTTGDEDNWRMIAKHNNISDIATVEAWTLLEIPAALAQ